MRFHRARRFREGPELSVVLRFEMTMRALAADTYLVCNESDHVRIARVWPDRASASGPVATQPLSINSVARIHQVRNRKILLDEAARQEMHDACGRVQADDLVGVVGIGL